MFSVLVAEDNADDEILTIRGLARSGFPVRIKTVHDGEDAVQALADAATYGVAELPRLILLDIKLPKLNGIEVLRILKANPVCRAIPIVCLSSSDEPVDVEAAYSMGANGFIKKPTDYQEYLDMVADTARWWLGSNKLPSRLYGMTDGSFHLIGEKSARPQKYLG